MTAPFRTDALPPLPASPQVGGGSLLEILRRAKYNEDFFGVDQDKKATAKAMFAGASELPHDPSQVESTLDIMRGQGEGLGRILDQAKAGAEIGVPQSVVDIPEFLADFGANIPNLAKRAGIATGVLQGDPEAAAQAQQQTTQRVRQAFAPVAEPVRNTLQKAADFVAGAPRSPAEALARAGGQLASSALVPIPSLSTVARPVARAAVELGEAGKLGAPGRVLARSFGRTNKGYLAMPF